MKIQTQLWSYLAAALLASAFTRCSAQAVEYSCTSFLRSPHQAFDCVEAVFSEDPAHLTFGSVPPGNGLALGAVLERPTHFVSPFAPVLQPDVRDHSMFPDPANPGTRAKVDTGGYKSLLIPRLGAAISTNDSWYLTGTADWLPGLYRPGTYSAPPIRKGLPRLDKTCHKFTIFCTTSVLAVHVEGTHRVSRTVSYFGLGSVSPDVKYVYRLDETYGGVQARMPVLNWLTLAGAVEGRSPVLSAPTGINSIAGHLPPASLPGLTSHPTYLHTSAGAILQGRRVLEPFHPQDDPTGPFHLLHRDGLSTRADLQYHWYDAGTGASFQQTNVSAAASLEIGANTEGYFYRPEVNGFWPRTGYKIMQHFCGGPPADPRIVVDMTKDAKERENDRKSQERAWKEKKPFEIKHDTRCDFGTLDIRSHMVSSVASAGGVIPFYMLPTLGGQDIESLISLRGFENYRFRAPDNVFVQVEYSVPVYDPIALLLFYDTGKAGNSLGDLSFTHMRQDAGFGMNVRILRMTVLQAYFVGGRGSGLHPGFNLAKQF